MPPKRSRRRKLIDDEAEEVDEVDDEEEIRQRDAMIEEHRNDPEKWEVIVTTAKAFAVETDIVLNAKWQGKTVLEYLKAKAAANADEEMEVDDDQYDLNDNFIAPEDDDDDSEAELFAAPKKKKKKIKEEEEGIQYKYKKDWEDLLDTIEEAENKNEEQINRGKEIVMKLSQDVVLPKSVALQLLKYLYEGGSLNWRILEEEIQQSTDSEEFSSSEEEEPETPSALLHRQLLEDEQKEPPFRKQRSPSPSPPPMRLSLAPPPAPLKKPPENLVYEVGTVFWCDKMKWQVKYRGANYDGQELRGLDPDKYYSTAYCADENKWRVFLLQDMGKPIAIYSEARCKDVEEYQPTIKQQARINKALDHNNRDPANSSRCIMPEEYFEKHKAKWLKAREVKKPISSTTAPKLVQTKIPTIPSPSKKPPVRSSAAPPPPSSSSSTVSKIVLSAFKSLIQVQVKTPKQLKDLFGEVETIFKEAELKSGGVNTTAYGAARAMIKQKRDIDLSHFLKFLPFFSAEARAIVVEKEKQLNQNSSTPSSR